MGIVLATRLAHRLNLLDTTDKESILALMDALGLNLPVPKLPPQELLNVMCQDKKCDTAACAWSFPPLSAGLLSGMTSTRL